MVNKIKHKLFTLNTQVNKCLKFDDILLSKLNKDKYFVNHAHQLKRLDGLHAGFYEQALVEVEKT